MKLKYKIEKLEDVPDEHRSLYVQSGDSFILDAEGAADKGDLEHVQNRLVHMETEHLQTKSEYEKSTAAMIEERKQGDAKNAELERKVAELEKNRGGGAQPNAGRPATNGEVNPWMPETRNVTQQSKITKQNPEKAAAMRKAAGVS